MATIPTVTKIRCMADTKSMVMAILTDTKNPTERSTTPATLIIPSKKVGEYADAQEDYKKQSLNIKYSYDAVPTEYDYVEKYGWGRPTTIGSLYNGYGYGNQYPQQYGYGHQHSYGYKRPSYGYKKPSYRKKPYGYKSKYEKKPKEDQDWEEPKEETHEDGDWKDDTDEDWEE